MAVSSEIRNVGVPTAEVLFLVDGASIEIRMVELQLQDMVEAARTLKASHFIVTTHDGGVHVYDFSKYTGGSMRPIRSFGKGQQDAAVMYAIAKCGVK